MASDKPTNAPSKKKRGTKKVKGLNENNGIIQLTRRLPSKETIHLNLSVIQGPTLKLGDFLTFTLDHSFSGKPTAASVSLLQQYFLRGFGEKELYTLSDIDGLLYATLISINKTYGLLKPMLNLPPPYNRRNLVRFIRPCCILDKTLIKGQVIAFILDKGSHNDLVAKDVAFLHTSHSPKIIIPYVDNSCDHIKFRNKYDERLRISCQRKCSRKLLCGIHACPRKCSEICETICKDCTITDINWKKSKKSEKRKKSRKVEETKCVAMHGRVVHLAEGHGFIQPTRNVPRKFKWMSVYFNLSEVDQPDSITFMSRVSFKVDVRCPDRPCASLVKRIGKNCSQEVSKNPYTVFHLDGLLNAVVVSFDGKYGLLKPIRDLPSPYNHSKVVEFVTPDGISDKSFHKYKHVVFILNKDSKETLRAKDVAFIHASYNSRTTIPHLRKSCDHICFKSKRKAKREISCQRQCTRTLACTHRCPRECYKKCPKQCKHCRKEDWFGKEKCDKEKRDQITCEPEYLETWWKMLGEERVGKRRKGCIKRQVTQAQLVGRSTDNVFASFPEDGNEDWVDLNRHWQKYSTLDLESEDV